ncbi:MAG: hypothetical protein P4L93_04175 [Coriobacteriia bacterium]|nr:hypothetical protein [Coriobacteriia bacterium]
MTHTQVFGFEWGFLDEIARWALGVGVVVAAAGAALTRDPAFAVACVIAVAIDVVLVSLSVRRARHGLDSGHIDPVAPIVMLAGRLVVKAGLLLVAMLSHNTAAFWGAVAGVMVFDVTLAFGGSAIAVSRGMRTPREGG